MAATNQLQVIRKGRSPKTVCLGGFPNFADSHMANGHPDSSSKLHLLTNFKFYMHAALQSTYISVCSCRPCSEIRHLFG